MPDLSRRSFFRSMVAAGMVATIDPDELLWTAGKKKIFIPAVVEARRELLALWSGGGGWIHISPRTALRKEEFDAAVRQLQSLHGPIRSISTWSKS